MPWHVEHGGGTCGTSEWAVIKDSDGSTAGCHPTQEAAQAQLAALYANEGNMMASSDEREAAATRRAQAAGSEPGKRSQRSAPSGVGGSRSLAFPAQLRARKVERNGQTVHHLNGTASTTDTPYEMWDLFGPYEEIIDGRAFDDTLAADPDVAFLVNHRGVTMARHRPGIADDEQNLLLGMTERGLGVNAWLNPKRQDVSDLVVAIDDKNVSEMSFAFMLDAGEWSEDFTQFRITKVDLNRGDVSAVNYGANPYTNIAARSPEILAELDHIPAGAARAAMIRLQARPDMIPTISAPAEKTGRSLDMIKALLEQDDED